MPKLNIKLPNGHSQEIEINSLTEGSVLDLKKHMASAIDIPAEYQRVVYKGRILKDADPLTSVGLLDGVALHVVRSAGAPAPAAASTSAPAPAPAPTPAPTQQENNNDNNNNNNNAAANPFASLFGGAQQQNQQQQAPQQQNPFGGMGGGMGGLAGMMGGMGGQGGAGGMDPNRLAAAAQMMQSNPQMQAMMQQMMQNPQMMRTVLQMDPNINAMPEPQRSQTLDLLTNPLMLQGMMNMMGGQGGQGGGAGGMGGGMGGAGGANPFAQMMGGGGAGGQGGGAAPPANLPQQPQMSNDEARTRYASQLQQLQSMGFPNEDANIRALIMSQGNVDFAVARLLGD